MEARHTSKVFGVPGNYVRAGPQCRGRDDNVCITDLLTGPNQVAGNLRSLINQNGGNRQDNTYAAESSESFYLCRRMNSIQALQDLVLGDQGKARRPVSPNIRPEVGIDYGAATLEDEGQDVRI